MSKLKWWQEAVFCQIYRRSFADGDGVGDFQGNNVADQWNNQDDSQTCLVVLNMSQRAHRLSFSQADPTGHVIFSSHNRDRDTDNLSKLYIAPLEVYIAELR